MTEKSHPSTSHRSAKRKIRGAGEDEHASCKRQQHQVRHYHRPAWCIKICNRSNKQKTGCHHLIRWMCLGASTIGSVGTSGGVPYEEWKMLSHFGSVFNGLT